MRRHFNPPGSWPRAGRAFNHGVVEPEGRRIHITGQVAWDRFGAVVAPGDCGAQAHKCFHNVISILSAVGGRPEDIVSLTIFYVNPADVPAIQKARSAWLPPETAPASILIQCAGLVAPGLLVELVPVAVVPFERYRDPDG